VPLWLMLWREFPFLELLLVLVSFQPAVLSYRPTILLVMLPSVAGFPVIGEIFMPKEVCTQGFVGSESATDLGVTLEVCSNVDSAVDHGVQAEGTSASAAATPVGGEHLDNIGEFEFPTPFFW
jgi:hypothetical protein